MYCLLELLTAVCLVVVLATALFVASAAVIVIDEGMRRVFGRSANYVGQTMSFSSARRKGWKATISRRLVFLDPKAGKL